MRATRTFSSHHYVALIYFSYRNILKSLWVKTTREGPLLRVTINMGCNWVGKLLEIAGD
jgi:hypothetical protein